MITAHGAGMTTMVIKNMVMGILAVHMVQVNKMIFIHVPVQVPNNSNITRNIHHHKMAHNKIVIKAEHKTVPVAMEVDMDITRLLNHHNQSVLFIIPQMLQVLILVIKHPQQPIIIPLILLIMINLNIPIHRPLLLSVGQFLRYHRKLLMVDIHRLLLLIFHRQLVPCMRIHHLHYPLRIKKNYQKFL